MKKSQSENVAENTSVDIMDEKTLFNEKEKTAIREAKLQIPFLTNNKGLLVRAGDKIKSDSSRAVKFVLDNKNKSVKPFQGSAPDADNHCQSYPHRVLLVTHKTMAKAVAYAIGVINSDDPILPVKEETKEAKQEPKAKTEKKASKPRAKKEPAKTEEVVEVAEA